MARLRLRLILCVILAAMSATPSAASDESLLRPFGPQVVEPGWGLSTTRRFTFDAPTTLGQHWLEITGVGPLTRARVKLNGQVLLQPNQCQDLDGVFRQSVTLQAHNELRIRAFGIPFSRLEARVWSLVPNSAIPASLRRPAKRLRFFEETLYRGSWPSFVQRTVELPTTEGVFDLELADSSLNSALAFVNGRLALTPRDFQSAPGNAPIVPQAHNTLHLWLLSPPHRSATLRLSGLVPVPELNFQVAGLSVSEGDGAVVIPVTLSAPAPVAIRAPLHVSGTATQGLDALLPAHLEVAAGASTGELTITLLDDLEPESQEALVLTLEEPDTACLGTTPSLTLTITDNDEQPDLPELSLVPTTLDVLESAGTVVLRAQLSRPAPDAVSVPFSLTGAALVGVDVVAPDSPATIPAGETSLDLVLTLIDDLIDEPAEFIILSLGTPIGASLGPNQQSFVTLIDDDDPPTVRFSEAEAELDEGDVLSITLELSGPSAFPISVAYSRSGTAAPEDALVSPTQALFAPGDLSSSIVITSFQDVVDEPAESIILNLASATSAILGSPNSIVVTLRDDDPPPALSFALATQSLSEGDGTWAFDLQLSAPSAFPVSATLEATGSLTPGSDISAPPTRFDIAPGSTSLTLSLTLLDDLLDEPIEDLTLSLVDPINASLTTPSSLTLTLLDDDPSPVVTLSPPTLDASESSASVTLIVSLTAASGQTVTVPFSATGSLGANEYNLSSTPVILSPGQLSQTLTLTLIDDDLDEPDETLTVELGPPTNATLGAGAASLITVLDDDEAPAVSFALAQQSVSEGAGFVTVEVLLSDPSGQMVTVPFLATGAVSDVSLSASPVSLVPGETRAEILVTLIDDPRDEPDTSLTLTLLPPTNASLGATSSQTLTIVDDDAPPELRFALDAQSIAESAGSLSIECVLSAPSSFDISAALLGSGEASTGADTGPLPSGVTIPAGQTSAALTLEILSDGLDEPDETLTLTLQAPVNASLGSPFAQQLTILDDDDPPALSFELASLTLTEGDPDVSLTLLLSAASAKTVSATLAVSGEAQLGEDLTVSTETLSFAPGETRRSVTLAALTDSLDEPEESLILSLADLSEATGGNPDKLLVLVLDADPPPLLSLTLASASLAEGESLTLSASLSQISGREVTADLNFSGEARISEDYSTSANRLIIPAGQGSASVFISAFSDSVDEPDETLRVTLAPPVNADLGSITSAEILIVDGDQPTLTFANAAVSVRENTGLQAVTVQLSKASVADILVPYAVTGTATAGADFEIPAGPAVIPAGQLSTVIPLTILDDLVREDDETVELELQATDGATLTGTTRTTLTILDDDGLASFDLELRPSPPSAVVLGAENDLVVTARTLAGSVATDFTGFVEIRSSDGQIPLHQLILEFLPEDQGVYELRDLAAIFSVGEVTLEAVALVDPQIKGELVVTGVIDRPTIHPAPEVTTEQEPVTITGTSFPGGLVELVVDGQLVASAQAGPEGRFHFDPLLTLGAREIVVRSADPNAPGIVVESEPIILEVNPARLTSSSPANGDSDVAVTRETILRFNAALDPATLTSQALRAEFGGQVLASRVYLSPDQRTVTLFYDEPLPANARVRVSYDGDLIARASGGLIDGDGDGQPGGLGIIDFETLSLTLVPGTAVCGRVFASELANTPGGSVNQPLSGVRVTVDGMESALFAVTDANGNFRLDPAPAGRFFVHIDGRTANAAVPPGAYYPFVGKAWTSIPEIEVNVGNVFLPLIGGGALTSVSETEVTTVTFEADILAAFPELTGVELQVPADSLFSDDGSRGGQVGIAPVAPDRLPGELPPGLEFALVITIQTNGPTNFDVPVPIRFPNLDGLPPGAQTALWSFNHDTGRFEIVGSMTVSPDGQFVVSDPGVGILAPGWHGVQRGVRTTGGRIESLDAPPRLLPQPTAPQESVTDGCHSQATCSHGCQVLLHSGEENLSRVDLAVPGRGLSFALARSYRSRMNYDGPMGFGWTFNFNEFLSIQPSGDVIRVDNGNHVDTWTQNPDGSYAHPRGYYGTLRRRPDGAFVLRETSGFQRVYRSDGLLAKWQDRFGNRMLFAYDARNNLDFVVDSYGREFDFRFTTFTDGVDRLTSVTDYVGREVRYIYDARGDLVEVQSPEVVGPTGVIVRRVERYTYSSGFAHADLNHNILSVTAPEEVANGGPPYLVWTYGEDPADPMTFDRVLTETIGGTNASGVSAGGTISFQYERLNASEPAGQPDLSRGRATITERNGNLLVYEINELNHHIRTSRLTRGLRPGEPAAYVTRSFFNDDGLLLRRVFPEGNEVLYSYASGPRSQQKNLVEIRMRADAARGGGDDLVTTMTYEPLYNRVLSVTEPRGNATGYTPPLGSASAERYTSRTFYDYQEGTAPVPEAVAFGIDLSSVPRGLGDLNGDGRMDQRFANPVRVVAPSVQLRPESFEAQALGTVFQEIVSEIQWNDSGQVLATIDAEGNVTEYAYNPEDDPDGDGLRVRPQILLPLDSDATGYLRSVTVDARSSPRRSTHVPPAQITSEVRYDEVGNVVATLDPRGVLSTVRYNALNEPVQMIRGADVSEAAARGQLITGESAKRYQVRLNYDHNGRVILTEVENRDSTTTGVGAFIEATAVYNILSDTLQSIVEVDATTQLTWTTEYDPSQLPIRAVAPEGNEVRMSYDERNLPFTVTAGFGTPEAATVQFNYDRNGNRIESIDAEDNDGDGQPEVTRLVFDGFDRVKEAIDALGNRLLVDYDPASQVVRRRAFGHPAGQPGAAPVLLAEASFSHDELGRVFRVDGSLFLAQGFTPRRTLSLLDDNSDGLVTAFAEFDKLSRLTYATEDDGETSQVIYDGVSRAIESIDARGNRQFVTYDQNSNPLRAISTELPSDDARVAGVAAETFTTQYVYDQFNRVVRATDNIGQTARFEYDSRDNLVRRSDAEGPLTADPLGQFPGVGQSGSINQPGNTSNYIYDGLSRMIASVMDLRVGGRGDAALETSNPNNPDGQITLSYQFDGNSRLTAIIDDNGNPTTFNYDALNRKVRQTNADGESFEVVYDRDSNVIETTDPNGTVITNSFDALNRLTSRSIARAPGILGSAGRSYEYDGLSRMTRCIEDNGDLGPDQVVERVYDSLSRVVEERQNGAAISNVFTGDGKRVECTYPGGRTLTMGFDVLDRPVSVADTNGLIVENLYMGPGGRRLLRLHGNGTALSLLDDSNSVDIGYDGIKRLVKLRHKSPAGPSFIDRDYTYNRANVRTADLRHDDGGQRDDYGYDSAYRLTSSAYDVGGTSGPRRDQTAQSYTFDGVGNRRSVETVSQAQGVATELYTVNEMNEYVAQGATPRVHDDNGNLRDNDDLVFRYDAYNRLVEVWHKSSASLRARYLYDSQNRRTRKLVYSPAAGNPLEAETAFLYDGWEVCEERDGTGQTQVTYVYGNAIDEIIEFTRSSAHPLGAGQFYCHQDVQGNVVAVTDAAGFVAERRFYDDFGRALDASKTPTTLSSVANPYGFQGRRLDPETGLYYFRHRYLDTTTGRFIQRDPVWDPGNVGNQYSFCNSGPTARDPMGLSPDDSSIIEGLKAEIRRNQERGQVGSISRGPSLIARQPTFGETRRAGETAGAIARGMYEGFKEDMFNAWHACKAGYYEYTAPDGDPVMGTVYLFAGAVVFIDAATDVGTVIKGVGKAAIKGTLRRIGKEAAGEVVEAGCKRAGSKAAGVAGLSRQAFKVTSTAGNAPIPGITREGLLAHIAHRFETSPVFRDAYNVLSDNGVDLALDFRSRTQLREAAGFREGETICGKFRESTTPLSGACGPELVAEARVYVAFNTEGCQTPEEVFEAVISTIIHEAEHARDYYRGVDYNTQWGEFRAFRAEFVHAHGRQPNAQEAGAIWDHIRSSEIYSTYPLGIDE